MKTFTLLLLIPVGLFLSLASPLAAEDSPEWAGFITYSPRSATTDVMIPKSELAWLAKAAASLGVDEQNSLSRKDENHWMALTKNSATWTLQIHDETLLFNYRATVTPKTGKLTVQRGVDWVGTTRQADVDRASRMAIEYLQKARMASELFAAPKTKVATPVPKEKKESSDPWQRLTDGNLRFVSGKVLHPRQSMARIEETSLGQKPFAVVVTCSDSRVPPEILFDQGLGDLFVVRTAGEVVTEVELGSIEYAVEHLGAAYLVVLGHKKCGAVDATLKGGELPPNIEAIAEQIRPAVEAAHFLKGDLLDNAIRENAKMVLAKIKGSEIIAEAVHEGKLNLKAAYYDIASGKVQALP